MFSGKVIRDRGYDVLSTHDADMHKSDDYQQIDFATAQGRAILIHNIRDFNRVAKEYAKINKSHSGIILSSQLPFKELLKPKKGRLTTESTEEYFDIRKKKTCSIAFLCALIKCKFILTKLL